MTDPTNSPKSLSGSPAAARIARYCILTLAVVLSSIVCVDGYSQDQPAAAQPAKPATDTAKAAQATPAKKPQPSACA